VEGYGARTTRVAREPHFHLLFLYLISNSQINIFWDLLTGPSILLVNKQKIRDSFKIDKGDDIDRFDFLLLGTIMNYF
jgi:hypothetical protein